MGHMGESDWWPVVVKSSDFQWPVASSLGGGFKYFSFSPLLGEDSHFD